MSNLATAKAMIDAYNAQDVDAYVAFMTDDACEANYRGDVVREGKEGTRAGLAIVLVHNVWTFDWRVIITILGWLAVLGGIFRAKLGWTEAQRCRCQRLPARQLPAPQQVTVVAPGISKVAG